MNDTHRLVLDMQLKLLTRLDGAGGQHGADDRASRRDALWQELDALQLLDALQPALAGDNADEEGAFLVAVMEAFGRHLAPGPLVHGPIAAMAVQAGTAEAGVPLVLPNGWRPVMVIEPGTGWDAAHRVACTAEPVEGGYRLTGDGLRIADADMATHLLVPARIGPAGEPALFCVPVAACNIVSRGERLVDGTPVGDVVLNGGAIMADAPLARGAAAETLIARMVSAMIAAQCGEAVGIMQAVLDQTVTYARQRQQFGKPLASFQVLQHDMVHMLIEIEQARSLAIAAASTIGNVAIAAAAKARTNLALRQVTERAVQIHGGIGTTDELALSRFFRRAMVLQQMLGDTATHQRTVVSALATTLTDDRSGAGGAAVAPPPALALRINDPDAGFRDEVADFLATAFTPALRAEAAMQTGTVAAPALAAKWHRLLYDKGWIAPGWPAVHGGTGWTPAQRLYFENECARHNTPILPAMGLNMCGPVLIGHGTEAQRQRFLPHILSGAHIWCQGYSEPGAGSDLASLRTSAVAEGEDYIVNGTKIWTTFAHVANWMFALVRTNPDVRPQQGISFLLIPMDSPGITITPILSMSGEHEVNQVFFDNVRVPQANRVGAENDGWTVAKYLLEFERGGVSATARTLRVVSQIEQLIAGGRPVPDDIIPRLARLKTEIFATETTQYRLTAAVAAGAAVGNTNASIIKLKASELYQQASQILLDACGMDGIIDRHALLQGEVPPDGFDIPFTAASRYMNSRALSIFGGASEIQKNILARTGLGL